MEGIEELKMPDFMDVKVLFSYIMACVLHVVVTKLVPDDELR